MKLKAAEEVSVLGFFFLSSYLNPLSFALTDPALLIGQHYLHLDQCPRDYH